MNLRYTNVKPDAKSHCREGTSSTTQRRLRKTRGEINNLEKERQTLIENTDPIGKMTEHVAAVEDRNDTLAEHVAYIEHLNTELRRDVKKWTTACNALLVRASQLEDINRALEHANRDVEKAKWDLETANRELEEDVDAHRSNAIHVRFQLKQIQSHLGLVTATSQQRQGDIEQLRMRCDQLDDDMVDQSEEMERLVNHNEALGEAVERLEQQLAVARQTNQHLANGFFGLVAQTTSAARPQQRKRAMSL